MPDPVAEYMFVLCCHCGHERIVPAGGALQPCPACKLTCAYRTSVRSKLSHRFAWELWMEINYGLADPRD